MYILDFLSVRKIINSDQNLKLDMERRFINLEKFFNKNKNILMIRRNIYTDIKLPIKDVDGCKRIPQLHLYFSFQIFFFFFFNNYIKRERIWHMFSNILFFLIF